MAFTLAAGNLAAIAHWLNDDGFEGRTALVASSAMVVLSLAFLSPVIHERVKSE